MVKFFSTCDLADFARRFLRGFEEMSFWRVVESCSGFCVGTRSPVLSSVMISGMPPTLLAMTGRSDSIASVTTSPNDSLSEGRTNISEDFISFGMLDWCPISSTYSSRPLFAISFWRVSFCGPSPAMMNLRFGVRGGVVSFSMRSWIAFK